MLTGARGTSDLLKTSHLWGFCSTYCQPMSVTFLPALPHGKLATQADTKLLLYVNFNPALPQWLIMISKTFSQRNAIFPDRTFSPV